MTRYILKDKLVAEIKKLIRENELYLSENASDAVRFQKTGAYSVLNDLLHFIDTLEVKESDETAEAFARIIRANLTGIDKDVQDKFEQLYKKITGEKMYQGFKD